jgi:D-cysteine desulfhydrase
VAELSSLPSLGWVVEPSPVSALANLGAKAGTAWLGAKRDDLLPALHGGSKVRKLDALLATAPWKDAKAIASFGAIGSGHLVCCAAAAKQLGRGFDAYTFWEPLSESVLDNLALTAVGARHLEYFSGRMMMGLKRPFALLGKEARGAVTIPPGASNAVGTIGMVRAGVELAEQIRSGLLPKPDKIYVAWGSGGAAAGLAIGLGLAGVDTTLIAVATVERLLSPRALLEKLIEQTRQLLELHGVPGVRERAPVRIEIDRAQLGPGYGHETAQSLSAVALAKADGLPLEPVYTGKAMASLLAGKHAGQNVLFWVTARRPVPRPDGWREKLPPQLLAQLERAARGGLSRRRVIWAGVGLGTAAFLAHQLTGYADIGWTGQVLSAREAQVVAAAAEALLPSGGPSGLEVAANVDRFVATMRPEAQREVHLLMNVIEHTTTPLGLKLNRFTRLSPEEREGFLAGLAAHGGQLAQAYKGMRDLCLMGFWQDPRTWSDIGYLGPMRATGETTPSTYEALRAPAGMVPK